MAIGDRFVNVIKAASKFLQSASIGTYIGMVSFHKNVQVRSNLVEIMDDDTRDTLIKRLPESDQFGVGTSLGSAVQCEQIFYIILIPFFNSARLGFLAFRDHKKVLICFKFKPGCKF